MNSTVSVVIIIFILFFSLIFSGINWTFAITFLLLGYLFAGAGLALWYWFNKKIQK